jgi:hypothetical protein
MHGIEIVDVHLERMLLLFVRRHGSVMKNFCMNPATMQKQNKHNHSFRLEAPPPHTQRWRMDVCARYMVGNEIHGGWWDGVGLRMSREVAAGVPVANGRPEAAVVKVREGCIW